MGRETCRTSSALKVLLHLHVVLTHLRPAAVVRMPEITDNAPLCGYTADVAAFVKHLQSGANRHDTSRPAHCSQEAPPHYLLGCGEDA